MTADTLNKGQKAFFTSMRKYGSTYTKDGSRRERIARQLEELNLVKMCGVGVGRSLWCQTTKGFNVKI